MWVSVCVGVSECKCEGVSVWVRGCERVGVRVCVWVSVSVWV